MYVNVLFYHQSIWLLPRDRRGEVGKCDFSPLFSHREACDSHVTITQGGVPWRRASQSSSWRGCSYYSYGTYTYLSRYLRHPFKLAGLHLLIQPVCTRKDPGMPAEATSDARYWPLSGVRRRHRAVQSCFSCRSRKLKCDKQRPCKTW